MYIYYKLHINLKTPKSSLNLLIATLLNFMHMHTLSDPLNAKLCGQGLQCFHMNSTTYNTARYSVLLTFYLFLI